MDIEAGCQRKGDLGAGDTKGLSASSKKKGQKTVRARKQAAKDAIRNSSEKKKERGL